MVDRLRDRNRETRPPHLVKEISQLRHTFCFFIEITSDPYPSISRLNGSSEGMRTRWTFFHHLPQLSSLNDE